MLFNDIWGNSQKRIRTHSLYRCIGNPSPITPSQPRNLHTQRERERERSNLRIFQLNLDVCKFSQNIINLLSVTIFTFISRYLI